MRKLFFACLSSFLFFVTGAQDNGLKSKISAVSLPDSIRKYFNYDTLQYIPCSKLPAGVYALNFTIGNDRKPYDCEFSQDSLTELKGLFTSALERALRAHSFQVMTGKKYMQLFYYNNILGCLADQDILISGPGQIQKQVSDLLEYQLYSIESSVSAIGKDDSAQYIVLPTAIIKI